MKTEVPIYSRLYSLTRMLFPFRLACLMAFLLLSFSFMELRAQDNTQTTITVNSTSFCSSGLSLTANVTDLTTPANTPTGTVNLLIDGNPTAVTGTLVNGTVTVNTGTLTAGPHTFAFSFTSDVPGTYGPSPSTTVTETITVPPTITATPANQTVCSGNNFTIVLTGGAD